MLLERQKILSNEMVEQRMRKFGKTIGTWICNNEECKTAQKSFIFNFEAHISQLCNICDIGDMIEDETLREKQSSPGHTRGKQGEDAWMSKQSVETQANILLGESPKY